MAQPSPTDLYRRATTDALAVAEGVRPDQLDLPTPCSAWTVQDLFDHLVGGTHYLTSAIAGTEPSAPTRSTPADFGAGVNACLAGLAQPGALDRTCTSPLGFDWPVAASRRRDVHGRPDPHLGPGHRHRPRRRRSIPSWSTRCIAMFLPDMPERGRAAGIVGPAVPVPDDATAQDRLLAAMGRRP